MFNNFFVDDAVLPQTKAVIETRSAPLGVNLVFGDINKADFSGNLYGIMLQYPGKYGQVNDFSNLIEKAHQNDVKVIMVTSLGDESKVMEAIIAGAKGYVLKPISNKALKVSIEKIFPKEDSLLDKVFMDLYDEKANIENIKRR